MKREKSSINEVISSSGLVEGEDFEIVSYVGLDEDYGLQSAHRFFDVSYTEELPSDMILRGHPGALFGLAPTPFVTPEHYDIHFYKVNHVHFVDAVTLGLGVVKILKGRWKGAYFLYNFYPIVDEIEDIQTEAIDEALKVKVYMQLTDPACDDRLLESFLEKNSDYLYEILPGDPSRIIHKLDMIYQSKKGRVIPFSKRA